MPVYVYVDPQLARFQSAESFDTWEQALDAAVERDRPVVALVGAEVAKCFPSRVIHALFAE